MLYFPNLNFRFQPGEERFLDSRYSDGKSKNINLRADDTAVRGAQGSQQDLADLYTLIRRYADNSELLVRTLFPEYIPHMTRAGTSLRPSEIAGRRSAGARTTPACTWTRSRPTRCWASACCACSTISTRPRRACGAWASRSAILRRSSCPRPMACGPGRRR